VNDRLQWPNAWPMSWMSNWAMELVCLFLFPLSYFIFLSQAVTKQTGKKYFNTFFYFIGCSIRFEDCTSDKTVLKYMTDGMMSSCVSPI